MAMNKNLACLAIGLLVVSGCERLPSENSDFVGRDTSKAMMNLYVNEAGDIEPRILSFSRKNGPEEVRAKKYLRFRTKRTRMLLSAETCWISKGDVKVPVEVVIVADKPYLSGKYMFAEWPTVHDPSCAARLARAAERIPHIRSMDDIDRYDSPPGRRPTMKWWWNYEI